MEFGCSRVIQVSNIAPQATRDQMHALFSFVGKIDEIRLYPSVRDATVNVQSRVSYVRFGDAASVGVAQHLTNTVFIDRALVVAPVTNGQVPDEREGLEMAAGRNSGASLPSGVSSTVVGGSLVTTDSRLEATGVDRYPPLPASTDSSKVEEIRRTVAAYELDTSFSAQQCMEFFAGAGEVKYFRFCSGTNHVKYALVEYSDQASVVNALLMNGRPMGNSKVVVRHSTVGITKPRTKSNEAAQKEIEEAMTKVKEAQNLVSAAIDPVMGIFGNGKSRSRSRSKSHRSRSRGRKSRSRGRRSRSRGWRRRSRSRERRRSRSRRRSRDRRSRRRSRSRDRKKSSRKSRSRSRERKKTKMEEKENEAVSSPKHEAGDVDAAKEQKPEESAPSEKTENGVSEKDSTVAAGSRSPSKKRSPSPTKKSSRSRSKKRSRSRSRRRSRSRSRRRSRSRDRRRSRSRDRRRRSRSRDRRRRSRSRSRDRRRSRSGSGDGRKERRRRDKKREAGSEKSSSSKVARNYDEEEKGFENSKNKSEKEPVENGVVANKEIMETEDMDISNSP